MLWPYTTATCLKRRLTRRSHGFVNRKCCRKSAKISMENIGNLYRTNVHHWFLKGFCWNQWLVTSAEPSNEHVSAGKRGTRKKRPVIGFLFVGDEERRWFKHLYQIQVFLELFATLPWNGKHHCSHISFLNLCGETIIEYVKSLTTGLHSKCWRHRQGTQSLQNTLAQWGSLWSS